MSEWQPIETAPKDCEILLYFPTWGCVRGNFDHCKYNKTSNPYWSHDREKLFGIRVTRENKPTHWMPLPAPPVIEK